MTQSVESSPSGSAPLTDHELELVKRLFSDPFAIPLEFKAWLVAYLEANPPLLSAGSISGLRGAVMETISAQETANISVTSDFGPTAITGTGNGDALTDFPTEEFQQVKHYFEMAFLVQDVAGGSTFEIRLHDGTAPGPLIRAMIFRTASLNPGNPMFMRFAFVPSLGSHTYHLRWRSIAGGTFTMKNSTVPLEARILRA